jgi:hypothetical protein
VHDRHFTSAWHAKGTPVPASLTLHRNLAAWTTPDREGSGLSVSGGHEAAPPTATAARTAPAVSDERERKADATWFDSSVADVGLKRQRFIAAAPWLSALRTALGTLGRNKIRSALTMLGVIIGVATVIALTEIGEASKKAIQTAIASMGADILIIRPGAAVNAGVRLGIGTVPTLKPTDADEMLQQCPAVRAVTLIVRANAQVVYGNRNWIPGDITGTTPAYLAVCDWGNLDEGQVFTDRDVTQGSRVCVIGATVKRELFADESPSARTSVSETSPSRSSAS